MDMMRRFPSVEDFRLEAKRRIPGFVFDFLEGGAGDEANIARNRAALDEVRLLADYLEERDKPTTDVEILGTRHALPFGVAPIGLGGLMWPKSADLLARSAAKAGAPFCLSTVASSSVETIGPMAGEAPWFQLYPIRDPGQEGDLLKRAWDSGFRVLAVTVDIVGPARRVRDIRNGFTVPPTMTLANIVSMATCPVWGLTMLGTGGAPRFENLERYFPAGVSFRSVGEMIQNLAEGGIDWKRLERYRQQWQGPIVVKGVLSTGDARRAVETAMDGLMVSNHGGRQLDALPSPMDVLPALRAEVGPDFPLIVDSGLRSGTDIVRAYALGADFTFLGRAFMYAVGAMGQRGADHAMDLLTAEVIAVLTQLGCPNPKDAPKFLAS